MKGDETGREKARAARRRRRQADGTVETMKQGMKAGWRGGSVAAMMLAASMPVLALAAQPAPATAPSATPSAAASPAPAPSPSASPVAETSPVIQPLPLAEPEPAWTLAEAQALLAAIEGIEAEGLIPTDYQPDALRAAIAAGEGLALNAQAARSFAWLAEDLRDGRTPVASRPQWFAKDPDQDLLPTSQLMLKALENDDIAGVLAGLAPRHANYAALKAALAAAPRNAVTRRNQIRINMDRWRWLPLDLGEVYMIANLPEFQTRLMRGERLIRNYRIIIGKPGRTQTPELFETIQNVVFNPTWTVPQSIVVGEGLGERLLRNPAQAAREGYTVRKLADGMIVVVQQPGPNNALGLVKIDMPNPHAIYMHDTPNRNLFNAPVRAFSHGCLRTEDAMRLGITMSILGAGITPEQAVEYSQSGKYTKVAMTRHFPVYITYFTMGRDVNGTLASFNDIYERDAPLLASFAKPREPKTDQRTSNEEVIELDNPL